MKEKGKMDPIAEELERQILTEVVPALTSLKMKVLCGRRRLPQSYPELEGGPPSRLAVLHGDLGVLVGTLDAAIAQAMTTAGAEEDCPLHDSAE